MDFPYLTREPITFDESGRPRQLFTALEIRKYTGGEVAFSNSLGLCVTKLLINGVERYRMWHLGARSYYLESDAHGRKQLLMVVKEGLVESLTFYLADERTDVNTYDGGTIRRTVKRENKYVRQTWFGPYTARFRTSICDSHWRVHGWNGENEQWCWRGEHVSCAEFKARLPRAPDFGTLVSPRVAAYICKFV